FCATSRSRQANVGSRRRKRFSRSLPTPSGSPSRSPPDPSHRRSTSRSGNGRVALIREATADAPSRVVVADDAGRSGALPLSFFLATLSACARVREAPCQPLLLLLLTRLASKSGHWARRE